MKVSICIEKGHVYKPEEEHLEKLEELEMFARRVCTVQCCGCEFISLTLILA
jgi:hypothetical protein